MRFLSALLPILPLVTFVQGIFIQVQGHYQHFFFKHKLKGVMPRDFLSLFFMLGTHMRSVADPERFDVDPDPTFHADADPDSKLFS